MSLRARPIALTLLLGGTLLTTPAHAAFWDSWFDSDTQDQSQLGPKRVPERNAGDRTPADALNFNSAQPHAAGASNFATPQPQVQGMIDQPDMSNSGPATFQMPSNAPTTPLFTDPAPAMAAAPAPMPPAPAPQAQEEPGFGDRLLSWAGLSPEPKANPAMADIHVTDQTTPMGTAAIASAPAQAPVPSANPLPSVEYYDADGYPILSSTPESPIRPDIKAKTSEARALSNTNQAAEATRQSFMEKGENAFAPTQGLQAYQPAPLDQPLPTGPIESYPGAQAATVPAPGGPMDELAFGAAPAPQAASSRAVPPMPEGNGRQPVNAPETAQYATPPEPLRAARLSDAPLEAPPAMTSTPPASIDLMATDSPAPQPTPAMVMVPARQPVQQAPMQQAYTPSAVPASLPMEAPPTRQAEPTAPASRMESAPVQAYAEPAPVPTPEQQNRAVPNRAPANLASEQPVGAQPAVVSAQPIPASNAPIPLPPPIAAVTTGYGEPHAPGEVPVAEPGTPGANRIAPLRYLPDSRYAERRGVKTSDAQ